jgi:hypothetical protein
MISVNQGFTILAWFILTVLISFLMLIARFYQRATQERTYFWGFLVPIALFGFAAARYAFIDRIVGDPFGDMLMFMGGSALMILCLWLYRQMTGH